MERSDACSIFEYLYRDAGNYKTYGNVLLAGRATPADEHAIRSSLDADCFVADQVGIPALQPQHLRECGAEMGALDHGFHEFAGLHANRTPGAEGRALMSVAELVRRFRAAADRWDPGLSPFGRC